MRTDCLLCTVVLLTIAHVRALDGTAYFISGCGGAYSVYRVEIGNGHASGLLRSSDLGGHGASQVDLSPDGTRIAIGVSGGGATPPSIWIANSDGTGLRKLTDCPYKNGWSYSGQDGFQFTDAGIYWNPNDRDTSHDAHDVYLSDPETGATSLAYHVDEALPQSDMVALKCSNDGLRHIVWTPHDTVMNDADHATRGPLISLNGSGTVTGTRWFHQYEMAAHGYGISPSGEYIYLVPFASATAAGCTWNGYHGSVVIRRWSDGQVETCILRTVPEYLGGSFDPTNGFNMAMCRNSDDHFVVGNGHPTYGCNGWWFVINWRTGERHRIVPDTTVFPYSTQDIKNDSLFWCGSCLRLATWWHGQLPSNTSPVIAATPRSLNFTADGGALAPQTVSVTNGGAGTLTAVQASVSAGTQGWLSAAMSGSGDSQTLTVSATPGALASGAYQGMVTLSGGGATNTVSVSVTLNVGTAVNAPGNTDAYVAGDSAVTVTWTDNSDNETGFEVEQATDSAGPWTTIAAVSANATSHTEHYTLLGVSYCYRVRAVTASGQSGYSNLASVFLPVPRRVVITSPAVGDTLTSGEAYTIRWNVYGGLELCDLVYSLDGGETWVRPILGGILAGPDHTAFYTWTVPSVQAPVIGVAIRVWPYNEGFTATGMETAPLTIIPSSSSAPLSRSRVESFSTGLGRGPRVLSAGSTGFVCTTAPGDHVSLHVYGLDGSLAARLAVPKDPGTHVIAWNRPGCYVARLVPLH